MKNSIAKSLVELNGQIAEACDEYDRNADDITVVAVTKTFPAAYIQTAVANGIHNIGESRIQDAEPKITELGQIARYHMIGHLQTNKVKKAIELFDVIQSVDSDKLAAEISKQAGAVDRTIDCLLEVNSSGEEQKYGLSIEEVIPFINNIDNYPNINLVGLMTIGPNTDDEDAIREAFKKCYDLYKEGQEIIGGEFDTLSMGMSNDFPLAIAEGSTMIRIGSLLFGERTYDE
ncbi:MAG: YggS family pyridoxal phosphate-dependent enzyme [Calditrichaeota bacterium]|nr:MAG: YggS family pyridoxal phosphate-dependent enzyme [Calditrichota bacterium]